MFAEWGSGDETKCGVHVTEIRVGAFSVSCWAPLIFDDWRQRSNAATQVEISPRLMEITRPRNIQMSLPW